MTVEVKLNLISIETTDVDESLEFDYQNILHLYVAAIDYYCNGILYIEDASAVTIVRIFHYYNFFHIYSLHINIKYFQFQYVTSTIYIVNVLQFAGFIFYLSTSVNILIRNVDFRKGHNTVFSARHLIKKNTSSE